MSTVNVTTSVHDRATPVVLAIGDAVSPRTLGAIAGRAGVRVFKRHFHALDRSRANALGGERTHFYAGAANATHFDLLPDGVLISVNQVGIRQRILGGTIRPVRKKYLTLPARAEAYGKRASEFNDLVLVFGRGGQPIALARATQTTLKVTGAATALVLGVSRFAQGETAGGEILFWLRPEVTQRADPSVAPSLLDLGAGIMGDVNAYIDRAAKRAAQAANQPGSN